MKKLYFILITIFATLQVASAQTGRWSGEIELRGMLFEIIFNFISENPTIDIPEQSAKGIPIQVKQEGDTTLIVDIPSIYASYKGSIKEGQIVGTLNQMGYSLPLTLTPGIKKLNRPQTPIGPFPYKQEEVTFTNGDACLKGTLTLPKNTSRNTPVLIMVSGSGLQNRDEEIFEHKPFAVIANALALAGIATLRYDDRGFGESTGDADNATTEDFKEDALAGIQFLRNRFDKVGIIGHSEGGTIALMLAAAKKVDFAISLAGMVISGAETLISQTEVALTANGMPQEEIKEYCKLLHQTYDAIINGNEMPDIEKYNIPSILKQSYQNTLVLLQQDRYIRYLIGLDIRPLLSEISCPILALNGTKDQQVNYESNLNALSFGLRNNHNVHIQALKDLNHLFQHSSTGNVSEYKQIEETFAPQAIEQIIKWLSQLELQTQLFK